MMMVKWKMNLLFQYKKEGLRVSIVRFIVLTMSGIMLSFLAFCQDFSEFEDDNITTNGNKFLLYTPYGYNPQNSYPLLVSLHGGASIGSDLGLILTQYDHRPPARLIMDGLWPDSRPFLVLSPQLVRDYSVNQNDQEWPLEVIDEVIEYVKLNYSVNNNKIYLTGISLGGAAVWDYAANFPDNAAAINPFTGVPDLSLACSLKDIPIWAFHGSDDWIPPELAIDMINAIESCSPAGIFNPKLNLLNSLEHKGWNGVYDGTYGYDVFSWMLEFSKNDPSNKLPYVNAGHDKKVISRNYEFYLNGDYFDWDGYITSVQWSKLSGPTTVTLTDANTKFLKINSLPSGIYVFQLSVTDNSGGVKTDIVNIEVVDQASPLEPEIIGMTLYNGATNLPIMQMEESMIINKSIMNVDEFNILAVGNTHSNSVKFSVNTDHDIGQANSPFFINWPWPDIDREWNIREGSYSVCVTPYPYSSLLGDPGVMQCYKLSVYDQPLKHYYSKPNMDLSQESSWNDKVDGSGDPPISFSGIFEIFNANSPSRIDNPLIIDGVGSMLIVTANTEIDIKSDYNGKLIAESNAVINVHTSQPITVESAHATSQFNFYDPNAVINAGEYGHIALLGGGKKTFGPGITEIKGNLTINTDTQIDGSVGNLSSIILKGSLISNGVLSTESDNKLINLELSGASQTLSLADDIALRQIKVLSGSAVTVTSSGNPIITLGSLTGGGLISNTESTIDFSGSTIAIRETGTINPNNEQGTIGLEDSDLIFISGANQTSHLYPMAAKSSLQNLVYDGLNSTELVVHNDSLKIKNSLEVVSGTINTNGLLKLLSTSDDQSAYIKLIPDGSQIIGDVTVQRYMSGEGRIYRYISSPVENATVAQLQLSFPISGEFTDSDNGTGDVPVNASPSMYYYDEFLGTGSEWVAFPSATGDNLETLTIGRGYSAYIREATLSTNFELSGPLNQGDINFTLTDGTASSDDGWNLLGNPYAAPIQWGGIGWDPINVGPSVAVKDNGIGPSEGGFHYWDGSTGTLTDGIIAQGQSFWIQTTGAATLTIYEDAKHDASDAMFYRTTQEVNYIKFKLTDGNQEDFAFIKFVGEASDDYAKSEDTYKLSNDYFNLSSLSTDTIPLAINAAADTYCSKTLSLRIDNVTPDQYSFVFDISSGQRYNEQYTLSDHYLGTTIDLNQKDSYQFEISQDLATYYQRFSLTTVKGSVEKSLSITDTTGCDSYPFEFTIANGQDGVEYYVVYADGTESTSIISDGGETRLQLDTEKMLTGMNNVELMGSFPACEKEYITAVTLDVKELVHTQALGATDDTIQVCLGEDAQIEFSTIPDDAHYRYYTDSSLTDYVDFATSTLNIEQVNEPATLYYTAVNALGCEGDIKSITIKTVDLPTPIITLHVDMLISNYEGLNYWYLNDNFVDSTEGPAYKPLLSGFYSVAASQGNCIKYSEPIMFIITGLVDEMDKSLLSVYPNPVEKNVIQVHGNFQSIEQIYIVNQEGKIIYQTKVTSPEMTNIEINLSSVPQGFYYLIGVGAKSITSIRFVLN